MQFGRNPGAISFGRSSRVASFQFGNLFAASTATANLRTTARGGHEVLLILLVETSLYHPAFQRRGSRQPGGGEVSETFNHREATKVHEGNSGKLNPSCPSWFMHFADRIVKLTHHVQSGTVQDSCGDTEERNLRMSRVCRSER